MNDNIVKTIIRVVQDYCFNNAAPILSSEFSLYLSPLIFKLIKSGRFDLSELNRISKKRSDFFTANDVNLTSFCKGLYKKLNCELSFFIRVSFFESIVTFKRKMENGNYRGFPKDTTSEDTLRSTLVLFIEQETFSEPRAGAGKCDIVVPSENVVIETKLWRGKAYYESGFPELNDYLVKNNYLEGYYIIFDYNQTPNEVILDNEEVFDLQYMGKKIHVLFIKMNAISPSKIYKNMKL